jgi:hypothetical protein
MNGHPIQLRPVTERDDAIRELLETTSYVNADGSPYVPDNLDVDDPIGDADMGDYEDDNELAGHWP